MRRDAASPGHARARAPVGHRWVIAAAGNNRLPDRRHHVVFHHARSRLGEYRGDDFVEYFRGALHPGDFFGAFHRAGVLQEFPWRFRTVLWERRGALCRAFQLTTVPSGARKRPLKPLTPMRALSSCNSFMRAIIGGLHSRRDARMSLSQSCAMRHHSISLPPRTNAVGSPDCGNTTATSVWWPPIWVR